MGIIIDTKAEEVAQPNLQTTCNQLATDTISRQAAIEVIRTYLSDCCVEDGDYHASGIEYELNALPSAQTEIIHCRDCKWKNRHNCTRAVEVWIDDDKFCAWGERKDNE